MEHLGQVRDHQQKIESLGAKILAVSFASASDATEYQRYFDLAFPIASDEPRAAYRAYGLGRGSMLAVYGIAAMKQHFALRRRGFEPSRESPKQDTLQLGGDFVIDARGTIRFAHPGRSGDDRAEITEVLSCVERCS